MKKSILLMGILSFMMAVLTSCGGGVDYSDPRSVAEKALECYHARDYETMKTLVNPANEYRIKDLDRMVQIAKENPNASKPEKVEFAFEKATEEFTGKEITADSKGAVVEFNSEKWPRRVVLEQVDGKWYFDQFK